MSIESELDSLASPLAAEGPCGVNLEDTQLLASFDAFRLFGQSVSLPDKTDWRAIKASSLDALGQSRDLRLLAHFAAASLRVDGWPGFLGSIHVAQTLIKQHWDAVYPRVDEDAILRKNALGCLSDHLAIIDGLRRTPIIENKQLGRYSLRDIEIATGKLAPSENEPTPPPSESEIQAVLAATPLEDLQKLEQLFATAIADLQTIDAAMREFGGAAASPDFDSLLDTLGVLRKLLRDQLEQRGEAAGAAQDEASGAADGGGGGKAVGNIKSRQDAIRALDTIAAYFRQNEPSSPVPIFIDRAKNLIGKNFLDILQDVAPDGVAGAKLAGGIRDE